MSEVIPDESPIMQGTEADKAADYANYFCSYSYLYHQKQMLMDHNRMKAYHSAIMRNQSMFAGKVVLDVGTGSGVLSLWAAQAGAAKVFAVEFTDMAKHARKMVEKNGFSGVIEVIQSSVEDLQLDCKVDIIISEWMGYFLLRESMLDSVIRARNRWMKPDGVMFPSHATMFFGAISNEEDRSARMNEFQGSMMEWVKFSQEMKEFYNLDMSALNEPYEREQAEYYVYSSLWTELHSEHNVGQAVVIKRMDLNTCTLADAECVPITPFEITVPFAMTVSGFAGWFTVDFAGSASNLVSKRVTLTTGPEGGYTHWGQQVFYLKDAIQCTADTKLSGVIQMPRQEKNKRLYNFEIVMKVDDGEQQHFKYEIP